MCIFKYLFFAVLAIVAFVTGVNAISVEPDLFSQVFYPFGLDSGLFVAMSIPVVDLYGSSNIGLGRIASHHPNTYIESKASEGETSFGKALQYGTARSQVKTVTGASGVFAGAGMYSVTAGKLSEGKYEDADSVGVARSGFVTVYVEEAVNAGDAVRVRHTNHASLTDKVAGNFAKTAEAGKTYLLGGARFEKTTDGAGETIVWLSGEFTITADV
jgi:hypothetical protein